MKRKLPGLVVRSRSTPQEFRSQKIEPLRKACWGLVRGHSQTMEAIPGLLSTDLNQPQNTHQPASRTRGAVPHFSHSLASSLSVFYLCDTQIISRPCPMFLHLSQYLWLPHTILQDAGTSLWAPRTFSLLCPRPSPQPQPPSQGDLLCCQRSVLGGNYVGLDRQEETVEWNGRESFPPLEEFSSCKECYHYCLTPGLDLRARQNQPPRGCQTRTKAELSQLPGPLCLLVFTITGKQT